MIAVQVFCLLSLLLVWSLLAGLVIFGNRRAS